MQSIYGGQCWYCGELPQMNEYMGNTAQTAAGIMSAICSVIYEHRLVIFRGEKGLQQQTTEKIRQMVRLQTQEKGFASSRFNAHVY